MDHLVFACPDLAEGVALIEELLGVESSPGGQHPGVGTHNRLVGLGPGCYMEVVAIDPDQPEPPRVRWFGLDDLRAPRLVTWCAKSAKLEAVVAAGRSVGVDLGAISAGGRERPDGTRLDWVVTDPWADRAGGIIPFFIDWGETVHPAASLPALCSFTGLRAEHPDAKAVRTQLDALGLAVPVTEGPAPRLVATLRTPNGIVELR